MAIIFFRQQGTPELFCPWLFSSQECEAFFRAARSLTSTYSTIINFSLLDLTYRIQRIQFQTQVIHQLGNDFIFPRKEKEMTQASQMSMTLKDSSLPTNEEIYKEVSRCRHKEIQRAIDLGIVLKDFDNIPCSISLTTTLSKNTRKYKKRDKNKLNESEEYSNDNEDEDDEEENVCDNDNDSDTLLETIDETIEEDLSLLNCGANQSQNETEIELLSTAPYVHYTDPNGHTSIIRKSWIYSSIYVKLSNDRLSRVKNSLTLDQRKKCTEDEIDENHIMHVIKKDNISIGQWCSFIDTNIKQGRKKKDKRLIVGRILSFSDIKGRGKQLQYSYVNAPIGGPKGKGAKGISCLCSLIYIIKNDNVKLSPEPESKTSLS